MAQKCKVKVRTCTAVERRFDKYVRNAIRMAAVCGHQSRGNLVVLRSNKKNQKGKVGALLPYIAGRSEDDPVYRVVQAMVERGGALQFYGNCSECGKYRNQKQGDS